MGGGLIQNIKNRIKGNDSPVMGNEAFPFTDDSKYMANGPLYIACATKCFALFY